MSNTVGGGNIWMSYLIEEKMGCSDRNASVVVAADIGGRLCEGITSLSGTTREI